MRYRRAIRLLVVGICHMTVGYALLVTLNGIGLFLGIFPDWDIR